MIKSNLGKFTGLLNLKKIKYTNLVKYHLNKEDKFIKQNNYQGKTENHLSLQQKGP